MSASTQILTDLNTVRVATPTAATVAAAIAAAGPIQDVQGAAYLAYLKAQELKVLCAQIKASSDAGDSNYTTIVNNVLLTLV